MSSVEPSSATEQGGLKGRVLRAASWTTAGYAARQVLRFGSNLIMTRLLFPEAFGLMTIVQAVLVGVTLMSDLAATQSVVRSSRGSDPAYVNTAWTIQILQGVLIAAVVVMAAEPLARHFGQPLLVDLLRVAALSLLFTGFNSTKIATAERRVEVKRLALIDTIGYAISIVAMILLAWRDPTPFALVQGTVIGNLVQDAGQSLPAARAAQPPGLGPPRRAQRVFVRVEGDAQLVHHLPGRRGQQAALGEPRQRSVAGPDRLGEQPQHDRLERDTAAFRPRAVPRLRRGVEKQPREAARACSSEHVPCRCFRRVRRA